MLNPLCPWKSWIFPDPPPKGVVYFKTQKPVVRKSCVILDKKKLILTHTRLTQPVASTVGPEPSPHPRPPALRSTFFVAPLWPRFWVQDPEIAVIPRNVVATLSPIRVRHRRVWKKCLNPKETFAFEKSKAILLLSRICWNRFSQIHVEIFGVEKNRCRRRTIPK